MIGSIRGEVIEITESYIIVETNGVGYLIHTTTPTPTATIGDITHAWIRHIVRENQSDLYGFFDTFSRDVFDLLVTIPKIGPRSAQQILQKASLDLLVDCVQLGDAKRLAKHSGLGPKTAEKVVTALTDKLPVPDPTTRTTPTSTSPIPEDIIDALVALGYPERDAYEAASQIATTEPELLQHTPQAITRALQLIGKS